MKHLLKYDKNRSAGNPAIASKIARFHQKVLTDLTELTEKMAMKLDTTLFFICNLLGKWVPLRIVKLFQFVDSCIYIFFGNMRIDLPHGTIIGVTADPHRR